MNTVWIPACLAATVFLTPRCLAAPAAPVASAQDPARSQSRALFEIIPVDLTQLRQQNPIVYPSGYPSAYQSGYRSGYPSIYPSGSNPSTGGSPLYLVGYPLMSSDYPSNNPLGRIPSGSYSSLGNPSGSYSSLGNPSGSYFSGSYPSGSFPIGNYPSGGLPSGISGTNLGGYPSGYQSAFPSGSSENLPQGYQFRPPFVM